MENKDKNAQSSESSLLLQLPNAMFSFSDMSGNSFLMPVAVEKSVDNQTSLSNVGGSSNKSEGCQRIADNVSVCQLEQPLLMRKASSPGPATQSVVSNLGSVQQVPSYSRPHIQPPPPTIGPSPNVGPPPNAVPPLNAGLPPNVGPPLSSIPAPHSVVNNAQSPFQSSIAFTGPSSHTTDSHCFNLPTKCQSSSNSGPQVASTSTAIFEPVSASVPPHFMQTPRESYNFNTAPPDYYSKPTAVPGSLCTESSVYSQQLPPNNDVNQRSNISYTGDQISGVYSMPYEPPKAHWLFRDIVESKEIWFGFSITDSSLLESAFQKDPNAIVPTDGGRYDAYLNERIKKSVYFDAKDLHIRRCTWFYRADSSQRLVPYEEEIANLLEQHYYKCATSGQWQKRVNIPGVGSVILESPEIMLHYKNELDVWPTLPDSRTSPKPIKRGLPDGFELMPDESAQIDHLVFIVQGIGSFCDLRFRTVSQCVDGFRDIANRLLISHFKQEVDSGRVGRVEFLPLAWHAKLHTSDLGLDRRMQKITLPSIPKLRHFTNDTLLDILLYSSPSYCQSIIDTVACELNKLYEIFLSRNYGFCGKVFVAGHSLGSLILFDILANQKIPDDGDQPLKEASSKSENKESDNQNFVETDKVEMSVARKETQAFSSVESLLESLHLDEYAEVLKKEKIDLSALCLLSDEDLKNLGLPVGPRKKLLNCLHSQISEEKDSWVEIEKINKIENLDTESIGNIDDFVKESHTLRYPVKSVKLSLSSIIYPRLHFEPDCFFALGSPISMFLAVRGYDTISEDFRFPTCPSFFHIFHPYDPVAFRIEPLIDPNFSAKPVLIPHHKGRKRMHLEIRENLAKVGIEIKQKVMETLRYTWDSLSGFAKAHAFPSAVVEAEVDKLVERQISESEDETQAPSETSGDDIQIGCLNGGRRIDFVLQEKPIEALNDYIFALTSHATYWDSEDTVLMILREIYAMQGIIVSSQGVEQRHYLNSIPAASGSTPLESVASNAYSFDSFEAMKTDNMESLQNIPSSFPPTQNLPPVITPSSSNAHIPDIKPNVNTFTPNIAPPPCIPTTQPLGPPPLSGFVKRSAFTR